MNFESSLGNMSGLGLLAIQSDALQKLGFNELYWLYAILIMFVKVITLITNPQPDNLLQLEGEKEIDPKNEYERM